ncbi:helix-turn-helix domain-containing protein [Paenibacillus elgii]|uniref:helix-turn-helix domain-containing protein n=1 Tax=Paenibacillus elgii TaxID=189691 RepID=UPI000248D3A8|nr:helix-turn-helix transcriptional regulator [Paenibacillus elgii]
MDIKKEIGLRLRAAREKARFSQTSAAKKIGIHNSTLGKYELGEREADNETLLKLANLYGVKVQWVLTGEEQNKEKIVDKIIEHVGEPGDKQREKFTNLFLEELNNLPEEIQKSLYTLIRYIQKK